MSRILASKPLSAASSAIPWPISPAPMTAILQAIVSFSLGLWGSGFKDCGRREGASASTIGVHETSAGGLFGRRGGRVAGGGRRGLITGGLAPVRGPPGGGGHRGERA